MIVAVCPGGELARRPRLFATLEHAFPVRFESREPSELGGADAALLIGPHDPQEVPPGLPVLVALGPEPQPPEGRGLPGAASGSFELGRDRELDVRLAGQVLRDPAAGTSAPVPPGSGGAVLARSEGGPVWVSYGSGAGRRDDVAFAPAELAPGEALRNRIQDGRALALLPLLHFLKGLTAAVDFQPPPLRAAFLIDDPNLHRPGYGHLRFRQLADHADEHEYHVAMAMVPLDAWFGHPGATRLFRERADRLSLLYHGNDHVLEELGRSASQRRRQALLAQARRRMDSFERRTGVPVSRVMTAPHGSCSEGMARDILRLGFDGLCIGRPHPWAARPPASWLSGPPDASPLAAFEPASAVLGGLPILLRRPFGYSPGDLALRAFLDQPLIVYGHHDDLAGGLGPFADWAERVRELGGARWESIGAIAAANYATRRAGDLLELRLHSRRAAVELPPGVSRLRVGLPGSDGGEEVLLDGSARGELGAELALDEGERRAEGTRRVEVALRRADALDPYRLRAPRPDPWPLARRFAGETRDRLAPLLRRPAESRARAAADTAQPERRSYAPTS